ncbi:hypothetical protein F4820DRAFT_462930 [Hypoxylon rubiginosum]|uniref:Uncharacterized protein n=1 Tax=Hypoxylon rubiginosum TaxID=110542 RepID=A0ACB9YHH4_9PEZI|nr:hypothetical protein F4820DRAFT_462930 [Hypoxylon rubiginosum]
MHSITAILATATLAHGHMIMQSPKPFGGPDLDNSPLTSSNYPCKLKGDPATFYKDDLGNTMAIGETQTLSFKGSAVHGGGSCQIAITEDLQPGVSTSWKVIQSIESGCPSKSGSGPDTYDFTIPDDFPPGKFIMAWTWVSKLAGQGEFYMNCAPITVTGAKKRSSNMTETATDGSFPELFVANLAEINDCKTEPSSDVEYPFPGPNVKKYGTSPKLAPPTGQNCFPKGITSSGSSGNGKSGPAANPGSAAVPSSSAAAASKSVPATFITSVVSGGTGGTGASASASSPTTPSSTVDVDPIGTPSETEASSSAAQSSAAAPSSTSSAAPATSSGPAGGNSSAGALTGACTEEGTFNCIGGTTYQQCASGSWSTVMQLAPTVKCAEGLSMNLWGRDESPLRRLRRRAH